MQYDGRGKKNSGNAANAVHETNNEAFNNEKTRKNTKNFYRGVASTDGMAREFVI